MSEQAASPVWRDPYTSEPTPKSLAGRVWFMLRVAYYRFVHAGSPLMAAAIAFYSLMCFMPLGIFMVWALGQAFGGQAEVLSRLEAALKSISPTTAAALTKQIQGSLAQADPTVTGILGALGLLWGGHRLFEVLEVTLTRVWHGRTVRGILLRKVFAFIMLIAACALLGAYMFAVSAIAMMRARLITFDPHLNQAMDTLWQPLTRGIAAALAYTAFLLIYYFLPRDRVPMRVAAIGALLATALWEAATMVFSHYIGRSAAYQTLYGSMVNVVLFGLWAYTAGDILLVSAALSSAYFAVFTRTEMARAPELPESASEGESG